MRRTDHDGRQVARQDPPPFRVLADTYLAPPPPRAPEPYKVAPSSTSYSRAHRRSSFVILAETSPASPEAENASSTLSTGRVSPFRGRGFKGPPPRSMSRPQSPEAAGNGRRRARGVERRVSVSQQNSPRRSLIPQPTYRQRSTSLTKDAERSPSPKIGRRADSRTRFNISNSRGRLNAADSKTRLNRSDSRSRTNLVEPRIRFISNSTSKLNGNATTTTTTTTMTRRHTTSRASTRLSPIQGTPTKPEKTNARGREPAKPPQRNNNNATATRAANRNASKERVVSPSKIPLKAKAANGASSNTGRFITLPEQNSEKSKKTDKVAKEDKQAVQNGRTSSEADVREMEVDGNAEDEVNLRNLLKQTSQAAGTSSERLVNTTTTTAVQPLHIDANTLLADGSTASQPKERIDVARSPAPSSKDASPVPASMQNATPSVENQSAKAESIPGNDRKESSTSADAGNVAGQNPAKSVRVNGEGSAQRNQSANQRSARSNQNARASKQSDGKAAEDVPEVVASRGELPASDKMPTVMENEVAGAGGQEAEGARAAATSDATNGANVAAAGAVSASVNASSAAVRARNENRGSDASLKSSTGVSTNSIGSVRSTDTGVSVNTVRGVSSPREKTGVHMEKRSQEIETLSGNIVRIEQNGEPVLASGNEKQGDSEKLLARWGRSLSRYCKCCSGMRCLACRRDPKGLLWTKNKARAMVINDTPPPVAATALDAPPPTTNASWWSKLKTRCRCGRLREIKCCTRKARVAPAESPATCCPPERRCGAICRRVFGRCKCKRNADTQQRTRNTRAKHSITSVAPPPLSEEPKSKLPDVLVEHNSVMRGAIPCLPVPLAWFCLVWNVLLPGTGTVWSGLFNLCTGQPRFSAVAGMKSRLGALIVNLVVGVGQLFTVLFCLVGWGWSIWWGVTMVRLARKYKRFRASEAANNDLEARGGEPAAVPPGVPSQALREMERAR